MANTANGSTWTISEPGDTDPRNEGATEIRGLRAGVGIRMDKEHNALSGSASPADGGEHKAGSAVAYRAATTQPSNRPDGVSLTSADEGRFFIDSADGNRLYVYTGSTWVAVAATVSTTILPVLSSVFTDMQTATGWDNLTGAVVFLSVGARNSSTTSEITVEVEDTDDAFVVVATSVLDIGSGDHMLQRVVLVPAANHARILLNGATGASNWVGVAHRTSL